MNTKKLILSLSFLSTALFAFSQNAYDALNFSQTNPIMGTARYSAMGGALGALGGDATSMKDNPAGLGIYRSSDLTLTPNIYITNDNSVGFNVNNFAFILNFRNSGNTKGYVTSSLGVSYNRLKNFKRYSDLDADNMDVSMSDYFDAHAADYLYDEAVNIGLINEENGESLFNPGGLVNNQIRYSESGSIGEWNISYGLNLSNRVYLGISAGFVNLDYSLTTHYDEWASNGANDSWYLDNYYNASGSGFNFKFGAIVRATDFMRIGVAFHTPTFYNIDESISDHMDYNDYNVRKGISTEFSWSENSFDLQTPLKLQGSLGFIIGKRALIGLEYQFEDFSAIRPYYSDGGLIQNEKSIINSEMKITHTIKAGGEIKIIDGFSARLGFAFVSKSCEVLNYEVYSDANNFQSFPLVQPQNIFYYTGGLGYKGKSFYADLAYVHQVKKETFFEYLPQQSPLAELSLHNNNIMATIGFRF